MNKRDLKNEIKKALTDEAEKIKKDLSWFRFAKKIKTGAWRFLDNKEARWKKLEEIAIKIAGRHKNYTTGEVVDIMSGIVNE